jgi:hypothetical protein
MKVKSLIPPVYLLVCYILLWCFILLLSTIVDVAAQSQVQTHRSSSSRGNGAVVRSKNRPNTRENPHRSSVQGSALVQKSVVAPGDEYGGSMLKSEIEQAMLSGTTGTVEQALTAAKTQRGQYLGCPTQGYSYKEASYKPVSIGDVFRAWQSVYAPQIAAFRFSCPSVGREWAAAAMGAYYARLGGGSMDTTGLKNIALMLEAQQYKSSNAPEPLVGTAGVFGVPRFVATDSCAPQNVMGEMTENACKRFPDICVHYKGGLFPGQTFIVADVKPGQGWLDGGLAYDHAWAGVMMIEAALQSPDPNFRELCRRSALLAGEWAIAEPPVRNHSYTAKLVWLLAQLYDWTGDKRFRAAMLDKLERNLFPAVLMDEDEDGYVDGLAKKITFQSLASPAARRPGRLWDGQNSAPALQAINAWAVAEAYCALRDRDGLEADSLSLFVRARVRRYALAMLDNLADEINTLGVINPASPGFYQLPFAMLTGVWKIAAFEGRARPAWDSALAALWNAGGVAGSAAFGVAAANTGLMLAYKANQRYVPLTYRAPVAATRERAQAVVLEQNHPNPFAEHTSIRFKLAVAGSVTLKIYNALGREIATLLKNEWFPAGEHFVNFSASSVPSGMYLYRIDVGNLNDTKVMQVMKMN